MDPILEMLAEADLSSSSIRTVPIRRKRKRAKQIIHPGIPGNDNRWFPSKIEARQAAWRAAEQLGPNYTIKWDPAHGSGQQAHYHLVHPNGRPISGHFFYGKKVVRRARRGRSDGEALFEVSRSSRTYVRWVQNSLNRVIGAGLAVDGISGSRSRAAIKSFQRQAGLVADGIVGSMTEAALIRAGASRPPSSTSTSGNSKPSSGGTLSINRPFPLSGVGFYKYKTSGDIRRGTDHGYATAQTIRAITEIASQWQMRYPNAPRIGIGHISLKNGAPTPAHKSHRNGRDVDFRPVRNDGQEGPVTIHSRNYSRELTQELVNMIRDNSVMPVRTILFNGPGIRGVQRWDGHDDHLHVSFQSSSRETDGVFESQISQTAPDFDDGEVLFETNRRSRTYIRWVQSSLNTIMGAGLAVDGVSGRRTQAAIRNFQWRAGIGIDGKVGPITEQALLIAGAMSPHVGTPSTGRASLKALNQFSRNYIADMIRSHKKIDCADLAIEVWIYFADAYNIPIKFKIWDSRKKHWLEASRNGVRVRNTQRRLHQFSSVNQFAKYVRANLNARGLIHNTYEIPGNHRNAVGGDVYLWTYKHNLTGKIHRWGHTQLFDQVSRYAPTPSGDTIRIVEGSLPAIVPRYRSNISTYFTTPRQASLTMLSGIKEPHTGSLVGSGPRRFKAFQNLR